MVMPFLFAANAHALPEIQTKAVTLKVIPIPNGTWTCLACHYNGSGSASYRNLKPGLSTAYNQDTINLTKLKAKLNELPNTAVGLSNSGLAKTDIYQVVCTLDGVSMGVAVRDNAPVKSTIISAQMSQGTKTSPIVTDSLDGDGKFSLVTKLVGGANATYTVNVTKSAYTGTLSEHKGSEIYNGKLACRNSKGAMTGLAWRIIQDQ
jgi:hypothetical protein